MDADIQKKCPKCLKTFWFTAEEQAECEKSKSPAPRLCLVCRTSGSGEVSTALATLAQVREGQDAFLAKILPDASALFLDIQQLMKQAAAPIDERPRTFWEWLRDIDLQAQQMEKKLRAGNQADQLLRQRLGLLRQYLEVAKTMNEAEDEQMERYQKKLRAYLETLKLQEEIAQQQALRDERIKTRQLEETKKQVGLLNEINPPPPPPPVKPVDPVKEAIDTHRSQLHAKATAKQLVLCDCIKAVHKVYHSVDFEDAEKAAQIRVVTEAYNQELQILPKEVREFVEWVESGEYEAREEDDDEVDDEDEEDDDDEDDWNNEDEDED